MRASKVIEICSKHSLLSITTIRRVLVSGSVATAALFGIHCHSEAQEPATAVRERAAVTIEQDGTDSESNSENPWIPLFNGKDLTGWTPKIRYSPLGENYGNTFRVEDGVLKVVYDSQPYPKFNARFGHLFYEKPYSHYRLRAEYRFVGTQCAGGPRWAFRNNGLMLHCQPPDSMAVDQEFPVSIEVQLLGGDGEKERSTGNLCTPGTNVVLNGELYLPHCTASRSKTYHGDQWVTIEVEVRGSEVVRHIMEGEVILEYSQPQFDQRDKTAQPLIAKRGGDLLLTEGYIAIQAESAPIEFRKIELQVLSE